MKKCRVTLTADEREQLSGLIASGQVAAQKLTRARILLKADQAEGGPGWIDEPIADALEVRIATIERVRQWFVEHGLEPALVRKKPDEPSRERDLGGAGEARLIALARSPVPLGRVPWTLEMVADELVELKVVDSNCPETVRQTPQKTTSSRGAWTRRASRWWARSYNRSRPSRDTLSGSIPSTCATGPRTCS